MEEITQIRQHIYSMLNEPLRAEAIATFASQGDAKSTVISCICGIQLSAVR